MEKFVLVTKYNNRKLYVAEQGYITLNQIEAYIKNNINFRVEAHKTKEDVTSEVLGQLLTTKKDLTVAKIKGLL